MLAADYYDVHGGGGAHPMQFEVTLFFSVVFSFLLGRMSNPGRCCIARLVILFVGWIFTIAVSWVYGGLACVFAVGPLVWRCFFSLSLVARKNCGPCRALFWVGTRGGPDLLRYRASLRGPEEQPKFVLPLHGMLR